jgi:phage shock protein PspC (stress-responsive transcriptional regulator)
MRTLRKSRDRRIAGVCGGIAEYFGWDPTIIRIIWAVMIFCYGTGILAYIIAAIIMPEG